jgi:hypothetical protein
MNSDAPRRKFGMAPLRVVLLSSATLMVGFGQNAPYLRPGSIEVGPFLGASYGIVSAQYMVGGNVTIAANKTFLPYVEYTYLPKVARPTITPSVGAGTSVTVDRNVSFSDFHGGVHIRLPIHEKPVVPYLAFGVGALTHFDQPVKVTFKFSDGSSSTQNLTQPAGSDFAVNGGVGLRFYFRSQRFGMRVEAKVYKPTGEFNSTFGKAEAGVFYQFR